METYIVTSDNLDIVKFINHTVFDIKVNDLMNDDEIMLSINRTVINFLINYNFKMDENTVGIMKLNDFIDFYNGSTQHLKSFVKNIGHIKINKI